ncbi:MAG: alpha-E domain-containing protein [Polyangia bacterium]|jgi:uncharacterized alpha-E superfamily protein
MLSRTADNLYWTGRYMERAENLARVLDVSYRNSLLGLAAAAPESEWRDALAILGNPAQFYQRGHDFTEAAVVRFFALDTESPCSIKFCVQAARENARALRAVISTEMWESINSTWLAVSDLDHAGLLARGLREFCDWVKERSHLFRGVSHGTTLHDDAFHFLRLGTFLERADSTARLLDTKYRSLESMNAEATGATYYAWGSVLRQASAFRAYHQTYHDVITPRRVAELLILRLEMPRSLRFCARELAQHLDALAGTRDLEAQRLVGELHARLRFATIDRLLGQGLHEFLAEVVGRITELSSQLAQDFLMTI